MMLQAIASWKQTAVAFGLAMALSTAAFAAGEDASVQQQQARRILAATGVQGGLIVQLGCGDGKLTAALHAGDSYLVHALDTSAENVCNARRHIKLLGLYGRVTVEPWTGERLPYVDNFVNLIVSEGPVPVSMDEVLRVLAPQGVAYVRQGEAWTRTVKPRPKQIDQWTHYLHDASGNAVAHDAVVGPPRHMQWVGSPRWSRHHDLMSSISALVSANGRIFYIIDEGPAASIQLPPQWSLVARDAFNGTVLWKRPIATWYNHRWPLKSGPAQLPRRLVAVGDTVYVTLGIAAPLCALDAATGKTIRTYRGSRATEEVIASDGVLFLLVNPSPVTNADYKPINTICWDEVNRVAKERTWDQKERTVQAVEADTGEVLWQRKQRVVPLTMAADRQRVFLHDGEKLLGLDRKTGERGWASEPVARRSPLPVSFAPTLVVYDDVVLCSGGTRSMTAVSAETGETLWTAKHPRSGHHSPEDLLVVDGLAWAGAIAGGGDSGVFTGRDLHTGEVKREFPPDLQTYWFHHRCYRSKATDRYLLPSRTGIEFVDVRSKQWDINHWVRGGCVYGIMPCNGLVYAPPHPCACYLEAKLNGFCSLAPESPTRRLGEVSDDGRLQRGEAYEASIESDSAADDWPTYRHDAARSGHTKTTVADDLKSAWQTELGGRLSSPVVAGARVLLASIDTHTVHALDAASGEKRWDFTAGGRVDSPPTIYQGRALFGSADGWVYCLRADDGRLIWRFRAAPEELRVTSFEQVESVWPVHGSVLVHDGVVYCVAGRSMFLDGGMHLLRLDPKTGEKLSETVLDSRDPETGDDLQKKVKVLNMPVALPDVLSCDGRSVYMRSQRFDLEGRRREIPTPASNPSEHAAAQQPEAAHLFSPAGFLDGTWWHRSYWLYGTNFSSGCNWYFRAGRFAPAGRLLVFDESTVYGFGRKPQLFVWTPVLEYQLYAAAKQIDEASLKRVAQANRRMESDVRRAIFDRKVTRGAELSDLSAVDYRWSQGDPPFQVRAMVLAGKTLLAAGPPDVVDEDEVFERPHAADIRARLDHQNAAWRGRHGALLWTVSAGDGKRLAQYELPSPPVWDGMAAASGRLYLSTLDGRVVCLAGSGR